MFTLAYNGVEKSLAAWGLAHSVRILKNGEVGTITSRLTVQNFDTDPLFEWGDKVVFYNQPDPNDVGSKYQFFVGWVTAIPVSQTASSEGQQYVFSDAMFWLTQLEYKQPIYQSVDPTDLASAKVQSWTAKLTLGMGINGVRLDSAQQIIDVLQYALDVQALDNDAFIPAAEPIFQIPAAELTRNDDKVTLDTQLRDDIDTLNDSETLLSAHTSATRAAYYAARQAIYEQWLADKAALMVGGYPSLALPWANEQDRMCRDVILGQLQKIPDAIHWFDYSTTPPTIYFGREADLVAKTLRCDRSTDPLKASEIHLTPRYDRQASQVIIQYEQTDVLNGGSQLFTVWDVAPYGPGVPVGGLMPAAQAGVNDRAFRSLNFTVPLPGFARTTARCELTTRLFYFTGGSIGFGGTIGDAAWIYEKMPSLRDSNIDPDSISYSAVSATNESGEVFYINQPAAGQITPPPHYELISGTIADWVPVRKESWNFSYLVSYDVLFRDSAGAVTGRETVYGKPVDVQLTCCNAASGSYSKLSSFQEGDPIPVGLASQIWDAIKDLKYDGDLKLHKAEIANDVGMGNKVNIAGGRAAWTTMNQAVRSETCYLDTGEKTITIGASPWLDAGTLVSLLNGNRNRVSWQSPEGNATGEFADETGNLPTHTAQNGSAPLSSVGETEKVYAQNPNYDAQAGLPPVDSRGLVKVDGFGLHAIQHTAVGGARPIPIGSQIDINLYDANGKSITIREIEVVTNATLTAGPTLNVTKKKARFIASDLY